MSDITTFDYEGKGINFEFGNGNKMINATEVAKPFKGKMVADFMRLKDTQEYITLLEERYSHLNIASDIPRKVLRVVKGGDAAEGLQGTWMDEKLALKFATWLSPRFELWVYDRIQELLTIGRTEIPGYSPSDTIKGLRMIDQQMEEQEKFNTRIQGDVNFIQERIDELEAKILSVDDHYYAIAGYCSLHKIPCPLHKAKEWGKAATALSRERDITTGTAHDERFGKVRTYHEDILQEVIKA